MNNNDEYTFLGLCNHGKPLGLVDSLSYIVGLVDSVNNEVGDDREAESILSCLFDVEEQQKSAAALLSRQKQFFPGVIIHKHHAC
jgi:hypothetical protein